MRQGESEVTVKEGESEITMREGKYAFFKPSSVPTPL